jgi:hypothetical protein
LATAMARPPMLLSRLAKIATRDTFPRRRMPS